MGRWEPNARGRLAQAALTLYAEQGFDKTTVAEIAARAGLTERTFFRHYADKREVLFYGTDPLRDILVAAICDAPPGTTPLGLVGLALEAAGAVVAENPDGVRLREVVLAANPELRERELAKLAEVAAGLAAALQERGITEPAASLAGEMAVAVFKVARARWLAGQGQDLQALLGQALAELREVLGGTLVGR